MEYTVIRSKRKTLSVHVDREGRVIVRSPMRVRNETIADFVRRHGAWIEQQRAGVRQISFSDGERIELLGRTYTIASGARASFEGEILRLPAVGREEALVALLRKCTRERMKGLLDELCQRYGFFYGRLTVTAARGRWGSCSGGGNLSFSFRSAFLPQPLAEYLAVHELCHTRHMDHSAAFWREVAGILPDYLQRRRALKGYLWAMNCL